jgi:hypothetical protein
VKQQTMFNRVWKHTILENQPQSINKRKDSGVGCAYRGYKGAKCYVGVLIPDRLYKKEMEGEGIKHLILIREFPSINKHLGNENSGFLSDLQIIHDCHFLDREEKLRDLAKKYNLKIPTGGSK